MGENQGEGLATIGEIAQGHGDVVPVLGAARQRPLERLPAAWWEEVDETVTRHPYSAAMVALAVGFLGGLAIAIGSRHSQSRGW